MFIALDDLQHHLGAAALAVHAVGQLHSATSYLHLASCPHHTATCIAQPAAAPSLLADPAPPAAAPAPAAAAPAATSSRLQRCLTRLRHAPPPHAPVRRLTPSTAPLPTPCASARTLRPARAPPLHPCCAPLRPAPCCTALQGTCARPTGATTRIRPRPIMMLQRGHGKGHGALRALRQQRVGLQGVGLQGAVWRGKHKLQTRGTRAPRPPAACCCLRIRAMVAG